MVKYSHKINGLTSINMTKLDVLTGVKKIKVAVNYELDGKTLNGSMPASLDDLARCKVRFREFDGWDEDISDVKEFKRLPLNAQNYITEVERELGIPITWVGTGPAREAMFLRD